MRMLLFWGKVDRFIPGFDSYDDRFSGLPTKPRTNFNTGQECPLKYSKGDRYHYIYYHDIYHYQ